jgi:hypothetical protein
MMPMQLRRKYRNTNVIVYFEEILDAQLRQKIELFVERVKGVTDAHFNETQKQLMIVDYDPKRTNSEAILSRVKRQHLNARLM